MRVWQRPISFSDVDVAPRVARIPRVSTSYPLIHPYEDQTLRHLRVLRGWNPANIRRVHEIATATNRKRVYELLPDVQIQDSSDEPNLRLKERLRSEAHFMLQRKNASQDNSIPTRSRG